MHRPDPFSQEKLSQIELAHLAALYQPQRVAFLYLDELTVYRQPTRAQAYEIAGPPQPLARRSHAADTKTRIVAALDALTGRVIYRQQTRITLACLRALWTDIRAAYPTVDLISIVVDNWPVHDHPEVLVPLQPQDWPWPPRVPANWPTEPRTSIAQERLPIQLLPLPTYASWLNPIEKLWRRLKQEVLHLHRYSAQWEALKRLVTAFLDQFSTNSEDLLHYVGLLPN